MSYSLKCNLSLDYSCCSLLYSTCAGREGDVLVGLRLPDHCHREPHSAGGQQHMEQHAHLARRTGHELDRGPRVRDNARARRRLRAGHLRRLRGLLVGRCVPLHLSLYLGF